jgi:hypothetical protein
VVSVVGRSLPAARAAARAPPRDRVFATLPTTVEAYERWASTR